MAKKLIVSVVAMIAIIAMVVSGCTPPPPQPDPDPDPDPRTGGAWIDEIVISQETSAAASILKMQEGTVHVYGHGVTDQQLFQTVADDPDLDYQMTLGGSREFMFNVYGPQFDDGMLNPFHVAEIREAVQWLIDRDYIVDELLGGMGVPLYTQFAPGGAEATRYKDLVDSVIAYYAYNPDKGAAIIAEEMENLGAELMDGKWQYEGAPVVIKQLIRIDLKPYPPAGDYLADVLDSIGFTVERLYRTSADTWWPILLKDPGLGLWNIYGGGWGMPAVFRTQVHSWAQFNTHLVMAGYSPWVQLEPLMAEWPEMYDAIIKLRHTDFSTMEERAELVEIALTQVRQFANNIWTCAITEFTPHRAEVGLVLDACGGVSSQFPFTVHFKDAAGQPVHGGSLSMELPSIMVQPMNPVEGSAMIYDIMVSRDLTGDWDLLPHPTTGLYMPQRIERAEVTIKTGLPVGVSPESADWCTLDFADEIVVPATAWADWDAVTKKFLTVQQRFGSGGTAALTKSVSYYPKDIFDIPLHDGSTLSVGDFLMKTILLFDRAKEASAIYDESAVAAYNTFMSNFKGVRFITDDPDYGLIVEYYSDLYQLDAELAVTTMFPFYSRGPGMWHTIALGIRAEEDEVLVFSQSKSSTLGVEWMSFIAGQSLPFLRSYLTSAKATNYIPYEPTMGLYVTEAEATERWNNLEQWYEAKKHFWVASGPFYLESADTTEKIVHLKRFEDYPDPMDRWLFLLEPLP